MTSFAEIEHTSYRPRRAIEFAWDQSNAGAGAGFRDIMILAPRLAAGTSLANEVRSTAFADADDAAAWFGAGSVGAYMAYQVFRGGNLKCKVWGAAVDEGAVAHATNTVTFVNASTTAGTWTIVCGGATIIVAVESGDSITAQGDALVAAFNALSNDVKPPCQPVNNAGTVTFTSNNHGPEMNSCPMFKVITGDEPATTTCTVGAAMFASGGIGPTLTTVLANLETKSTPILLVPWQTTPDGSTTALDLLLAHVITKSDAEHMGHARLVCCTDTSVATLATNVALLENGDGQRCSFLGQTNLGSWNVATACWFANMLGAQTDVCIPFNGAPLPYAVLPPATGDYPTNTELDTMLEAGVTPISVKGGQCCIERAINATPLAGGVPVDIAVTDGEDWFRYYVDLELAARCTNKKLADDGDENIDDNTVTPSGILDIIYHVAKSDRMKGILRDVDDLWPTATCTIDATVAGRVNFQVDNAIMTGLAQIFGKIRQRNGVIAAAV